MSILVIYIILGILYESFIHPITILSGLPSAGFGALLTLMIFRLDLNIYAFVGLIMLVGIVKKNAIMMIDFALEARAPGQNAVRRDLPGLPAALPPDHDDHHGGADGHAADRARLRRRRRSAAAAGSGRGRRLDRLATAHALHHAGDLSLSRIVPAMGAPASAASARGEIIGGRSGSCGVNAGKLPLCLISCKSEC